MAHEIESIDKQQGREMAWHGLTEIKLDLSLRCNWLADHDVITERLQFRGVDSPFCIATSDGHMVGKPFDPESYGVLTNAMILAELERALEGTGHVLESAGTVRRRSHTFLTFAMRDLGEKFKTGNGQEYKGFFNIHNSHGNMGQCLRASYSNIKIVCANTFGWSLRDKALSSIKHTKGAQFRLPSFGKAIEKAIGVQAEFIAAMNEFEAVTLPEATQRKIATGFVTLKPDGTRPVKLSTRAENIADRIVTLARGGAGNDGKTLRSLFDGITDFHTHEGARGSQFESSEFGSGSDRKALAFELFRDGTKLTELERAGETLMAARAVELAA